MHYCHCYGHTKSFCYCFYKVRCVKYAEDHPISNYSRKDKSKDIKCVLCKGNYSVNYKGYIVYTDLQKKTFPYITEERNKNNIQTTTLLYNYRKFI